MLLRWKENRPTVYELRCKLPESTFLLAVHLATLLRLLRCFSFVCLLIVANFIKNSYFVDSVDFYCMTFQLLSLPDISYQENSFGKIIVGKSV